MKKIALAFLTLIVGMFFLACSGPDQPNTNNTNANDGNVILISDLALRSLILRGSCDSTCPSFRELYGASQQANMQFMMQPSYSSSCCCPCDMPANVSYALASNSASNASSADSTSCPCPAFLKMPMGLLSSWNARVVIGSDTLLSNGGAGETQLLSWPSNFPAGQHNLTIIGTFSQGNPESTFIVPIYKDAQGKIYLIKD
jgi:hypothetical protein